MSLNLIWCKRYDTKHKMQKTHTSANSPKFESDKWPFYDRFWPFFCDFGQNQTFAFIAFLRFVS